MQLDTDTYNRIISIQEIQQSYNIFSKLFSSSESSIIEKRKDQKNLYQSDKTNLLPQPPPTDQQILSQPPLHNPLHKVVTLDCHRTRSTNFTQQQKKRLESFLNYFVRAHNIEYKQGLNEIAAPFVLFTRAGVPLSECYHMFQHFFTKFSLNFYYDKDFTGLEMFFRMISIVLRYHCPSLSRYLAVYDIEPQIYAMSWLMTLFSSKLSLQMTYLLWAYLVAENDRYLLFFIVVGIIIRRKNQIIQTQNSSVFRIVTDMIFKNQEELEEVMKISLILRKNTPVSLTMLFQEKQLFDRMESYKLSAELLDHINRLNLFVILPKQLYSLCKNSSKQTSNSHTHKNKLPYHSPQTIPLHPQLGTSHPHLSKLLFISCDLSLITKPIHFVIIDLRKQKPHLSSFPFVYSVDITQPFEQIETQFLNSYLEEISSKHFTILLTTFTFEDSTFADREEFGCAKKFLQVLNSYSFPYLGILEGGYTALSIYEQEFRVRKGFYGQNQEEKDTNRNKNDSHNGVHKNNHLQSDPKPNSKHTDISQNILLEGSHQLTLPLSLLFQMAQQKTQQRLKCFHGPTNKILLLTQCFLIVVQDTQGLAAFISYIQHNCSIVPYFYSNLNEISCKIVKVLPIEKIQKLKTIKNEENVLIIKFLQDQVDSKIKESQRRRTVEIKLESQNYLNVNWDDSVQMMDRLLVEEFRQVLTARSLEEIDGDFYHNEGIRNEEEKFNSNLNGKKHNPVNHRKESSQSQKHAQKQKQKQMQKQKQKYKKLSITLKDKQTQREMSTSIQNFYKLQFERKYRHLQNKQHHKPQQFKKRSSI